MGPALSSPPPQPNPDQQGALSGGGPPMQPGAQQQVQQPAPTHQQTVAALRHFAAIGRELEGVLKDPDVGRADIKDKVIDGVTQLVADRIIAPGQAVAQLTTFPERPFEQKQWLLQHLQQTMQARDMILAHHAMAFAGGAAEPTPKGDGHMADIAGMMSAHYSGKPNG